jgi:hypothetical protein
MGSSTPTAKVVQGPGLRGAEVSEADEAAKIKAADFGLSVASGTSG